MAGVGKGMDGWFGGDSSALYSLCTSLLIWYCCWSDRRYLSMTWMLGTPVLKWVKGHQHILDSAMWLLWGLLKQSKLHSSLLCPPFVFGWCTWFALGQHSPCWLLGHPETQSKPLSHSSCLFHRPEWNPVLPAHGEQEDIPARAVGGQLQRVQVQPLTHRPVSHHLLRRGCLHCCHHLQLLPGHRGAVLPEVCPQQGHRGRRWGWGRLSHPQPFLTLLNPSRWLPSEKRGKCWKRGELTISDQRSACFKPGPWLYLVRPPISEFRIRRVEEPRKDSQRRACLVAWDVCAGRRRLSQALELTAENSVGDVKTGRPDLQRLLCPIHFSYLDWETRQPLLHPQRQQPRWWGLELKSWEQDFCSWNRLQPPWDVLQRTNPCLVKVALRKKLRPGQRVFVILFWWVGQENFVDRIQTLMVILRLLLLFRHLVVSNCLWPCGL